MKHRLSHAIAAALLITFILAVQGTARTLWWVNFGSASDPINWRDETGQSRAPTPDDDVIFNYLSLLDCTWDSTSTVRSVTVEPTYAGTIIVTAPGGMQTGELALHGGRFNLSSGPLCCSGNLYVAENSSLGFSPEGTIRLQGGGSGVIQIETPLSIPNLIIDKPGKAMSLGSNSAALLDVSGTLDVQQGTFLLNSHSVLKVATAVQVAAPGTLELAGTTLSADRIIVAGTFKAVNSNIQSAAPGTTYCAFAVLPGASLDVSTLTLSGLNAEGLHVTGPATLTQLNNLTFENNAPGGTALAFDYLAPGQYTFDRCAFNGTTLISNVAVAPGSPPGSVSVLMTNASGERAGRTYEQDPNGAVYWSAPTVPPVAPVALSSTTIDWQWTNDPEADGYRIRQASSGVVLAELPAGTTHFVNGGLTANTTCTVSLSAYNPMGTSTVTLTCVTPANAPFSGGAVAFGGAALKVDWDRSGNPPGTEYFVRCSTDAAYFAHASSSPWTTATSWPFDHLISGATYYFQAKARNHALVETPFVQLNAAKSGFALPEHFAGAALSTGSVKWSWTDTNNGEAGYRLCSATGAVIAELAPDTTEYVEQGLPANTRCARTLTVFFVADDHMTTPTAACYTLGSGVDLSSAPYETVGNRTFGGVTRQVKVEVPQGTVNRDIYIDINLDPLASPREADSARIAAANAAMANGERCLPDTITEFNMYSSTGDHISGGFTQDVTIRLPYRDEDNDGRIDGLVPQAKVSALRMYTLNETSGRWEPVPCTIDTVNHQVVARVRHFSVYTLVIVKTASRTLGGLKVYPNPFTPGSRASGITFAGLTARANIRIYTVAGELVFEATDNSGTGTYTWAAVNSAGNRLASGVYVYIISNPDGGEKIKGKIAIQR